jgi:hypothetical protein
VRLAKPTDAIRAGSIFEKVDVGISGRNASTPLSWTSAAFSLRCATSKITPFLQYFAPTKTGA